MALAWLAAAILSWSHGPLVTASRPSTGEDVHLLAGNVAVTIHTTSTPISRYGLVSPFPIHYPAAPHVYLEDSITQHAYELSPQCVSTFLPYIYAQPYPFAPRGPRARRWCFPLCYISGNLPSRGHSQGTTLLVPRDSVLPANGLWKLTGRYHNDPDMRINLFRVEVGPGGRIGLSLHSKWPTLSEAGRRDAELSLSHTRAPLNRRKLWACVVFVLGFTFQMSHFTVAITFSCYALNRAVMLFFPYFCTALNGDGQIIPSMRTVNRCCSSPSHSHSRLEDEYHEAHPRRFLEDN